MELEVNNLKVGQIINSYKELCDILNVEYKKSHSKATQEKEFKRYFNWEKETARKIRITEIYLVPLQKEDLRMNGNNSIYKQDIIDGLTLLLRKQKSSLFFCSRGYIAEYLGFYNKNFRACRNNIDETSEHLGTPKENLLDFYYINQTRISKNITTGLEHFRRNSMAIVKNVIIVCDNNDVHSIATKEQEEMILECENLVKLEIGIQDDYVIYAKNMWDEYDEKVKTYLEERETGIKYYYNGYAFTIHKDKVEEKYLALKSKGIKIGDIRKKVNKNSSDASKKSVDTRIQNALERKEKGKNNKKADERDNLLLKKDTKKINNKCVNNLINNNANKIHITPKKELKNRID